MISCCVESPCLLHGHALDVAGVGVPELVPSRSPVVPRTFTHLETHAAVPKGNDCNCVPESWTQTARVSVHYDIDITSGLFAGPPRAL